METHNVAHTSNIGERVASIYADTYFNDDYCDYKKPSKEESEASGPQLDNQDADEWKSPSDLLIGILELTPPFTSKITRGITHQGILNIGNAVQQRERARFDQYISKLLEQHEVVWTQILDHQKILVEQKVKDMYKEILETKSNILMNEIHQFYGKTLQELEDHVRKEISVILNSTHASIMSDLNNEVKEKLQKEKKSLEKILQKRYESEVKKVKYYYKLLLENEDNRFNKVLNRARHDRNDALKAFYRQIEAETATSTMYVMCTERKKCKIRKFILDNYHSAEVAEKLKRIKEQEEMLEAYKAREKHIAEVNKEWEDKMKKILLLFLKFISFSLKLLPDQTTFLLDLEKLVVLQLNEMQKSPSKKSSILIDEELLNNFEFIGPEEPETVCDKEPFVIVGDTSDSIPTPHGSRESLESHVPLPVIRVQRQFLYAKCDKHEEVRAFIEAKRCKCRDVQRPPSPPPEEQTPYVSVPHTPTPESSFEHLVMDEISILQECPVRNCQDWTKKFHFPYMIRYLDYSEENYIRVRDIIGKPERVSETQLVKAKDFIYQELPFAATHEKTHNVGTQYSSQEDLSKLSLICRCADDNATRLSAKPSADEVSIGKEIERIMDKRKTSLYRLISSNPNLLKMFTDEGFDFIYTIK